MPSQNGAGQRTHEQYVIPKNVEPHVIRRRTERPAPHHANRNRDHQQPRPTVLTRQAARSRHTTSTLATVNQTLIGERYTTPSSTPAARPPTIQDLTRTTRSRTAWCRGAHLDLTTMPCCPPERRAIRHVCGHDLTQHLEPRGARHSRSVAERHEQVAIHRTHSRQPRGGRLHQPSAASAP